MTIPAVTYDNWRDISRLFPKDDETKGARPVLKWAYDTFDDEKIVYASSFGAEAIVLIDLIAQIKPDARIIFIDTELHFPQTYEVIAEIERRFPKLRIQRIKPELTPDEQAARHGSALWKRNPDLCCEIRKVIPMKKALAGKQAWISGLRREQSPERAKTEYINKDNKFKNIKICPLIYWTWEDVWTYIKQRNLPYNKLHDRHYPSIGCMPCTRPVEKDGDSRAGRWAGFSKTECGLHTD